MVELRLDQQKHGSEGFTTFERVVGLVILIVSFGVAVQLALVAWYNGRIMPGVVAAGQNIGSLTMADARAKLRNEANGYKLSVSVAGQKFQAKPEVLGVSFDVESTLQQAYQTGRNDFIQIRNLEPVPMAYTLDRSKLTGFVSDVAAKVGVLPTDATVKVVSGQVSTVADKPGATVDQGGLMALVVNTLEHPAVDTNIDLATKPVQADVRQADLASVVDRTNRLLALTITLKNGSKVYRPLPAEIGEWVTFNKQQLSGKATLAVTVDSARVKDFVQNVANDSAVAPVNKKVSVENGVSKTTQEGKDGLTVDQDDLQSVMMDALNNLKSIEYDIKTKSVPYITVTTVTNSPINSGGYIEVNLTQQHLWVWQDQKVIYESPVTSGATGAGLGTVTGTFAIYYKTTNTHLNGHPYGYDYDVPVAFWMPFYQGYGLHDASWRSSFGGPDYYYGGSHGCVNLPYATAAFIYNWSVIGTPVWIHN
jgi:lipoprotein-anchoring transpeptidase ErfK/SrfK